MEVGDAAIPSRRKKKVIWGAKNMRDLLWPTKKAATPPPAHPLRGTCWKLGTSRYLICVVCDNLPAGIFGGLCLKVHSRYSWSAYYGGKSTDNFRAGRRGQDSHAIKFLGTICHLEMVAK